MTNFNALIVTSETSKVKFFFILIYLFCGKYINIVTQSAWRITIYKKSYRIMFLDKGPSRPEYDQFWCAKKLLQKLFKFFLFPFTYFVGNMWIVSPYMEKMFHFRQLGTNFQVKNRVEIEISHMKTKHFFNF